MNSDYVDKKIEKTIHSKDFKILELKN